MYGLAIDHEVKIAVDEALPTYFHGSVERLIRTPGPGVLRHLRMYAYSD